MTPLISFPNPIYSNIQFMTTSKFAGVITIKNVNTNKRLVKSFTINEIDL